MPTSDDARFYAFLRENAGERALAVFNFQPAAQPILVNLAGQPITLLEDLITGEQVTLTSDVLSLELPAYGYKLFKIVP
jgi:hypothetical protein